MSSFLDTVETKFNQAKDSKDLFSFDTTEIKKESNGVEVKETVKKKKGRNINVSILVQTYLSTSSCSKARL